jgi:hypothetical protein
MVKNPGASTKSTEKSSSSRNQASFHTPSAGCSHLEINPTPIYATLLLPHRHMADSRPIFPILYMDRHHPRKAHGGGERWCVNGGSFSGQRLV